jgi:5-deoxy-glucuronate isomerase
MTGPASSSTGGAAGGRLHLPAGSHGAGGDLLTITPESAGWTYAALRVLRLDPGASIELVTGSFETAVLPLTAEEVAVEVEGRTFRLAGRPSVFDRVSDFAYLPVDCQARVSSAGGGEIALPAALARGRLDPYHAQAEAVPVEVRGAGPATRQVTNYLTPETFPAVNLCSVEVLTPDGNWSSYPPHKHDQASEDEAELEEVYYFRIEGGPGGGRHGAGTAGFAVHRTYTADRAIDATVTIADGDAFLIPRGYHGPSIAAPGYPLWYLNVLGGPGPERSMRFCDDPAHHWVRDSWAGMPTDPRCPMTTASGRRAP